MYLLVEIIVNNNSTLSDDINFIVTFLNSEATTADKPSVSRSIVNLLRNANPPSRFLRQNSKTLRWQTIGDARASERIDQMLRQRQKLSNANADSNAIEPESAALKSMEST